MRKREVDAVIPGNETDSSLGQHNEIVEEGEGTGGDAACSLQWCSFDRPGSSRWSSAVGVVKDAV